jgi:5'-nucleotidase
VTLQEVNAVGVLDIERGRFLLVRGLGYKDHGRARNALDPSDEDGGININPWEGLEGMYQPDAIASYSWSACPTT